MQVITLSTFLRFGALLTAGLIAVGAQTPNSTPTTRKNEANREIQRLATEKIQLIKEVYETDHWWSFLAHDRALEALESNKRELAVAHDDRDQAAKQEKQLQEQRVNEQKAAEARAAVVQAQQEANARAAAAAAAVQAQQAAEAARQEALYRQQMDDYNRRTTGMSRETHSAQDRSPRGSVSIGTGSVSTRSISH